MATELDAEVAAFRNRPLDAGPYTYVSLDALTQKVREDGRIVNVAVVIAVGVNVEGHREVLGFDVITTEDGAGWLAFLRSLIARGLSGSSWSPPTPTPAWSTPSASPSPASPGSDAAPTSCATC
jgi:putative transposase